MQEGIVDHNYEAAAVQWDMAEAVKVLYPSRYAAYTPEPYGSPECRFSPLLLEFGEIELQDWAVAASSSMLKLDAVSKTYIKSQHGKKLANVNSNGLFNYTTDHSTITINTSTSTTSTSSPSSDMKNIHGRLRLCSKSIVFEPHDSSRAIIKCPLDKLISMPILGIAPSEFTTQDDVYTILFSAHKHYVMKADYAVTPFTSIETPTEFRLLFLHSKPNTFLQWIQVGLCLFK